MQHFTSAVGFTAPVKHSQRAAPQQLMQAAGTRIAQPRNLLARQHFEAALRHYFNE